MLFLCILSLGGDALILIEDALCLVARFVEQISVVLKHLRKLLSGTLWEVFEEVLVLE